MTQKRSVTDSKITVTSPASFLPEEHQLASLMLWWWRWWQFWLELRLQPHCKINRKKQDKRHDHLTCNNWGQASKLQQCSAVERNNNKNTACKTMGSAASRKEGGGLFLPGPTCFPDLSCQRGSRPTTLLLHTKGQEDKSQSHRRRSHDSSQPQKKTGGEGGVKVGGA